MTTRRTGILVGMERARVGRADSYLMYLYKGPGPSHMPQPFQGAHDERCRGAAWKKFNEHH